jgi:hypothetical protein
MALERLQLPRAQRPFAPTPAAAPGSLRDAAIDRHDDGDRSRDIAELAPVGEPEGEI